jgi:hypothetical protein
MSAYPCRFEFVCVCVCLCIASSLSFKPGLVMEWSRKHTAPRFTITITQGPIGSACKVKFHSPDGDTLSITLTRLPAPAGDES